MAVTPTKSKGMDPNVVKHITHDYTFSGLDAIMQSRGSKPTPLRFLYISGIAVVRDLSKIADWVPEAMRPMVAMRVSQNHARTHLRQATRVCTNT